MFGTAPCPLTCNALPCQHDVFVYPLAANGLIGVDHGHCSILHFYTVYYAATPSNSSAHVGRLLCDKPVEGVKQRAEAHKVRLPPIAAPAPRSPGSIADAAGALCGCDSSTAPHPWFSRYEPWRANTGKLPDENQTTFPSCPGQVGRAKVAR